MKVDVAFVLVNVQYAVEPKTYAVPKLLGEARGACCAASGSPSLASPLACEGRGTRMGREQASGDLSRNFVGGTVQEVEDGAKARDGEIWMFVSADWEDKKLKPPNCKLQKGMEIPCYCQVLDGLLMATCIVVLSGKQCGKLHLGLVAHCREYLWSVTPPSMTRRFVEGSGMVDYLTIIWCIDADFKLYRNVTSSVGVCEHQASDGSRWDAFWYIYRRGDNTPAYSHIGLDTSAMLRTQTHVSGKLKEAIDLVPKLRATLPPPSPKQSFSISGALGKLTKQMTSLVGLSPQNSDRDPDR